MKDYTADVYGYVRSLGAVGDVVLTDIYPWLMQTYGLDEKQAATARRHAMSELKHKGLVERVNVRSRLLRILG